MIITKEIKEEILKILETSIKENKTIDDFIIEVFNLKEINNNIINLKDELEIKRKETKNYNEYQKITYQINKLNTPEIIKEYIFDNDYIETISAKTLYFNLLKYNKMPNSQTQEYFETYFYFNGINYDLVSIINSLKDCCGNYYSEIEIKNLILENNFDIFENPAYFMKQIDVSSTKSLNIRINKYNNINKDQIVPFNFELGDNTKTYYLKSDIKKLKDFLTKKRD